MENHDSLICNCDSCKSVNVEKAKEKNILNVFKFDFIKIALSAIFAIFGMFIKNIDVSTCFFIVSVIFSGYELIYRFIKNLSKLKIFNESTLMLVASITALILGEHLEGALVLILFSIGELLEKITYVNTERKIEKILSIRPKIAHFLSKSGCVDLEIEKVELGSLIEVRKGETVPIDGVLICGDTELDLKTITGESKIYLAKAKEKILSGAINLGNPIVIRTTSLYKDSTVEKIVELVKNASKNKSKSQKFITSFAKIYTPIVFFVALIIASVIPLFDNFNFNFWIYKSLSFLVVSCPCALIISVPLAYFSGIGNLAKIGILVKGSNVLEDLSKVDLAVFDKTGTLTSGEFEIEKIEYFNDFDEGFVKNAIVSIEKKSNHPISKTLVNKIQSNKTYMVGDFKEISGVGVSAIVEGNEIIIGNKKLLDRNIENDINTLVCVKVDNKLACIIYLIDEIKDGAINLVKELKKLKVNDTIIISGDNYSAVKRVQDRTNIDMVFAELLPNEKLDKLIEISKSYKNKTIFVGDGINDAPVLSSVDVGISMGKAGSEIAIDCSDVVITDDDIKKLPKLIKFAKKIKKLVIFNISFSLIVKTLIMILSLFFKVPVWVAMLGDVGVMILAVINSLINSKIK